MFMLETAIGVSKFGISFMYTVRFTGRKMIKLSI